MSRDNVIHLEEVFQEFQDNKLKWAVVGKQYHRFTIYQRCQACTYKIRVYKTKGGVNKMVSEMTKLREIDPASFNPL